MSYGTGSLTCCSERIFFSLIDRLHRRRLARARDIAGVLKREAEDAAAERLRRAATRIQSVVRGRRGTLPVAVPRNT